MLEYNLLKNLPVFRWGNAIWAIFAVVCLCGCGDPVPPPTTEKAELVNRFFASIDNKDVDTAMRQGIKLRSLDKHNENIIRLVEIQQCNAYIETAQKKINSGDINGAVSILRRGVYLYPDNVALREMLPRVRQLRNAHALLESMRRATTAIAMRSAFTAAKIGFSLNSTPALQKYFAQYEKRITAAEIKEKADAAEKEKIRAAQLSETKQSLPAEPVVSSPVEK